MSTIPRRPDNASGSRSRQPPRTAYVSLLSPSGRRRCWWYLYNCPACHAPQLGRARQLEDVAGPRRAGCGHQITVVIARTYGQRRAA